MPEATKTEIRKNITNLLRNQKEEERLRKSSTIRKKFLALPEFEASKTILFYASCKGEVETFEMMRQAQKLEKKIALPMTILKENRIIPILVHNLEEDLVCGAYDVQEPRYDKSKQLRLEDLDLVVVPGVAFDKSGNRLGRGAGFYDRFLKDLPSGIPTVGLAFDFQILSRLPQEAHDAALTKVISN